MNRPLLYLTTALVAASASLAGCALRPNPGVDIEKAPLLEGLGEHSYPVTTTNPLAQRLFDQGLILAYAFNHREAARSFRNAAEADPDCAMAHWGVALVLGPNINAPMEPSDVPEAYRSIQQALSLADQVTPKERGLIEALSKRYVAEPLEDRSALDLAYAESMDELARRFPEDPDIRALCAEALMDLSPWDYWDEQMEPRPNTVRVLDLLDGALARDARHALANHLYIHAVEYGRPELGIQSAKQLEALLPGAGHMVHMPSHIYIRVGMYHEGTLANERAILSDDTYVTQCHQQGIYPLAYIPHNHHFLWACATLEGRKERAISAALELAERVDTETMRTPGLETLQHYWITPLYAWVRFGEWQEVLRYPAPPEDLIYPNGIWHYARGMALARTGRFEEAAIELAALEELAAEPLMSRLRIWGINTFAATLEIASDTLRGELALEKGKTGDAIVALRKAVERQDATAYNEPPDFHYPVRQSLGAALLAAGRFEEAEIVYREDLETFPENGWSLHGLAQSLRAQNKAEDLAEVESRLQKAWQWSDVTLESSRF